MSDFFVELSIVMLLTFFLAFLAQKIKQPLLIGYIFTGIIAGPLFLNVLISTEGYETFSHIGITLLLFIVGLHLNLKLIKEVGLISLITGIGQVLFTSIIGLLISYALGYSFISSLFIAIALTFSSTIIIVKLLSDKKDLDTLYGKISMGFLIVQDLIAVILLMIISSFLNSTDKNPSILFIETGIFIIIVLILTYLLSKFIMPKFLESISKSTELLFLFILTWCLGIASIFQYFGFSIEVGALLAGVILASSPYQFEISAKIKPLRDFFIVMFFILLGSQMLPVVDGMENMDFAEKSSLIWDSFSPIILPAIILSLFVLVGNPLIVLILMGLLGYKSKTGFLAGLTVAQISEFSLILALLVEKAGYLTSQEVSMITLVGIITITASTYMILGGNKIYNKLEPILKKFERKNLKEKSEVKIDKNLDLIIFGYDRIGFSLLKVIRKLNKNFMVIDHNPAIIKKLKEKQINYRYGDAGDYEFLQEFNFEKIAVLLSTIPDYETNMLLLKEYKKANKYGHCILTSNNIDNALSLYKGGADYVVLPHFLGGEYIGSMIEKYEGNFQEIIIEKLKHIKELEERKENGIEHPKDQ